MKEENETQDELAKVVMQMSAETRGPDRYVVRAIGYQIRSNARLEDSINSFAASTANTEKKMQDSARAQIGLAWAQVFLAVAAIVAAIIFTN